MKIRIEYEVPEDDCLLCNKSFSGWSKTTITCRRFDFAILELKDGKFQRCQACLDAEVKEGE